MSTYKALVGKKIKSVSSDPSDSVDGQMWYNTTTQSLRGLAVTEAWASSGPLLSVNYGAGGAGSQTAMLYFGGANYTGSPPYPGSVTNATYEYNGVGWSSSGDYTGSAVYVSGCGTQTAGLGAGGFTGTATFTASAEYDGSTWTAGNSMSQKRQNAGTNMVGTQPAALITGGDQYPSTPRSLTACEEYDGTNWTSGGAYPLVIQNTAQAGTQTAGWAAGGVSDITPGSSNVSRDATNHYDGSSWSAGGTLPAVNYRAGAAGTQTAGLTFGGYPNTTNTFAYDGTTWTAKPALALARNNIGSGGVSSTSTAAIGAGGYDPGPGSTSATEEFTASTNVITAAAWSAGGNLNTARFLHAGAGSTPAGLVFGGRKETSPSAYYNNSEEYNGTSWTEGNNLNTARSGLHGIGTQTAGLACGGRTAPAVLDSSEEYDGTSYTEGNNLASARQVGGSAGTQTAGLIFNGTNVTVPAPANMTTTSQSYDGTSWTATNSCNTARVVPYGFGTQTAAISVGGNPFSTSGESFDGTNWTAISGTLNDGRQQGFSGGTSTNGLVCGGNSPPNTTNVEAYNGTIFTTAPSLSTARRGQAGTPGTSVPTGIFGAGGYTSTELNSTEEFTPESTAANIETFSTS